MKPFSLIVLLTLFSSPAAAMDDSWRDALIGYYRFDVALDTCADVRVSGEDVRLLESAISEAERRSGLSEEAMMTGSARNRSRRSRGCAPIRKMLLFS
jgi:hypothetical protein